MRRLLLLAALLIALVPRVSADEGAAFLKIGVGARAIGMGGAFTAVANDVNALAWNPAGLARLSGNELTATHADMSAGLRYDFLGVATPFKYGTFAAGGAYLSQDALEGRDANGHTTGAFGAADSFVSMGFAGSPTASLRLGGAVKVIQSKIANASAQTAALDLGIQRSFASFGPGKPLFGVSVQNMGPGLKFADQRSSLPLTFSLGTGYEFSQGILFALDVRQHPHAAQTTEIDFGTEYAVFPFFALRAGYGSARPIATTGTSGAATAINGFAAGFGLRGHGYTLDYSMTPFGELGNVQRFSLGARF